jgi:inner membrane transporter RhtA
VAGDLPHRSRPVRLTRRRFLDSSSPEALFVLSAIAQYVGAVIAVNLFDQVAPATVAWFRVIGAALVLLAVSAPRLARGGRWTRAEFGAAALFGVATALMNMFFYLAIERLPLGKGVTIEFIGPIAVAAARTRSGRNAAALSLAAGGVAVLSGLEFSGGDPLGLVFIFAASACWAAYIVVGSHVARLDRGVAGLGVGLAVGAVATAPFGAPGSGPVWISPSLLAASVVVGVF